MNIKVTKAEIKLKSLVMSSIIPSFKQIGSQVSRHKIIVYFTKSCQQRSLPWIVQNKFSVSFNKPTGCGHILNFICINRRISEKMDTKFSYFSYNCDLEWRSRSFKLIPTCRASYQVWRKWSVNVWTHANTKVNKKKKKVLNHRSKILSLNILNGWEKMSKMFTTKS